MARYITGIILALTVIALLLFAKPIYLKWLIITLSMIGCWEFLTISIGKKIFSIVLGILLTFLGSYLIVFSDSNFKILGFLFLVLFCGFVSQFPKNQSSEDKIKGTAFFVLGVFYCSLLFGLLAQLINLKNYQFWLFLTLACTFLGDTGAYFVGRKWGKHKLAPTISPGKTIEGLFGALVGGLIAAFIIRQIFWSDFILWKTCLLGVMIALIGALGDLSESLFKRGFGVKDSGTIIPGHGGLLDRVDALLMSGPFVYLVSHFIV